MKHTLYLSLLLAGLSNLTFAQTDTIRLPGKTLNTAYLKPGMNQYFIIVKDVKEPKSPFIWYWLRDIRLEQRNSVPVFTITQHWYASDTLNYREVYSINRQKDFGPVYHSETVKGKINAYNWDDGDITGADSIANNSKKDFKLHFNEPNYNWNLDIETFEMLPLAAGKVFAINFYDAGSIPPQYVIYKVTGSELLNYGGRLVDCWKLLTQNTYNKQIYSEMYWISKAGHEFLKEEDDFGNSGSRSKIKMPVNIK